MYFFLHKFQFRGNSIVCLFLLFLADRESPTVDGILCFYMLFLLLDAIFVVICLAVEQFVFLFPLRVFCVFKD